jgi:hypothetical protein
MNCYPVVTRRDGTILRREVNNMANKDSTEAALMAIEAWADAQVEEGRSRKDALAEAWEWYLASHHLGIGWDFYCREVLDGDVVVFQDDGLASKWTVRRMKIDE